MQRAREYVEHLKRKPSHERERIAFLSALAVTGMVSLGYLAALTSSGTLAFESSRENVLVERSADDVSSLLGAAAAFRTTDEGELTVVESKTTSTMQETDQSSATVIPF